MTITEQINLISHTVDPKEIDSNIQEITEKIKQQGDKPYVSVKRQLELLHQLNEFDFGRFLLQNRGVNGYWTHYVLTHPWRAKKTLPRLEDFLLNRAPIILATQQRFEIFLKENQKFVKNRAKLACIPCGMMGELLYLDYKHIDDIRLVGIDYDPEALVHTKNLAKKQKTSKYVELIQDNAWLLNFKNEFDLISSNGLNIYEPNDEKVIKLYRKFYDALKIGGVLVSSFITFPPTLTDTCEWDISQVNQEDLLLQKILFVDILNAKWQCFRSTQQTKN